MRRAKRAGRIGEEPRGVARRLRWLERPCPHCQASIDPYGTSVVRFERCPRCRRFLRTRVSLQEVAFWSLAGCFAGLPLAVLAEYYLQRGWVPVIGFGVLGAALALVRGRRFITDPRDGTAVHLRACRVSQGPHGIHYELRSAAGVVGDAQLDLRTGHIRLGRFQDATRRARSAAYLELMFADYRPGQAPPDERAFSG